MSLDFSYDKCKDVQAACTSPFNSNEWHPVGNQLVWATMIIGMNRITEANVDEFYTRINAYQSVVGGLLFNPEAEDDRTLWITRDDIVRYIGLHTNASSKTKTAFYATLARIAAEQGHRNPDNKSAFDFCAERAARLIKEGKLIVKDGKVKPARDAE